MLSDSPSHAPGPWVSTQFVGGAHSSLDEDEPISAPTLITEAIQGVAETYIPLLVGITVIPAEGTPQPYRVQIFQTSEPMNDESGITGHLIYEGPAIPFRYLVPAGGTKYFLGRVVGPGGICSSVAYSTTGFTAPSDFPEYVPQDMCLNIPLAVAAGDGSGAPDMPVKAFEFYPPREGVKLKSIYFQGAGCMVYSNNDCPDLFAEIVIGGKDTVFEVPTSPNETGKYAPDCNTKVAFGSSENDDFPFHQQMPRIPALETMPETADEYTRVRVLTTVTDPLPWSYTDKISVWVTACNWASGTNLRFAFAGNLILVFESIEVASPLGLGV